MYKCRKMTSSRYEITQRAEQRDWVKFNTKMSFSQVCRVVANEC